MEKSKIKWCMKQKDGIRLIELKPHLSDSYMKEAEEILENVFLSKGKWKVITSYYACYNAVYSLLMKCGIKCEIHECTLELLEYLGFEQEEIDFMKKLKEDRIQNQYYLKNIFLQNEEKVKDIILKCKKLLYEFNSKKIEDIRNKLMDIRTKRKEK